MKFYEYGSDEKGVIIMLPGSFCPACALDYLAERMRDEYLIILPEYNGHYEGTTFTTRKNEAGEIVGYILKKGIRDIAMVYGQSMGSEVGIELIKQLLDAGVNVGNAVFDGAPCIKLSRPYKAFMYFKFRTMINMMRTKTVDEVISWKFLNKFTNGDTASLKPMIESLIKISPFLTDESIKNENECCYTFDFPQIPDSVQKRTHFLYAAEEKAYKTCIKAVKSAYPLADYKIFNGYGHMTYSVKHTEEYVRMMKDFIYM